MGTRKGMFVLLFLAGCSSTPTPASWPEGPLREDEQKLLKMHDRIWDLIGLSPAAARELNTLVLRLGRNIKEDPKRKRELDGLLNPGASTGSAGTYERYFENHRRRFQLLGIGEGTQAELFTAMKRVWNDLHDPAAPPGALARAERIQQLMRPWLPPCQDDRILEYRKSVLRER